MLRDIYICNLKSILEYSRVEILEKIENHTLCISIRLKLCEETF